MRNTRNRLLLFCLMIPTYMAIDNRCKCLRSKGQQQGGSTAGPACNSVIAQCDETIPNSECVEGECLCVIGFHQDSTGCTRACNVGEYGVTYRQFVGIGISCQFDDDRSTTEANLDDCLNQCNGDDNCISVSYDTNTNTCIRHLCDPLNDIYYNANYASYDDYSFSAPNNILSVRNCNDVDPE